MPIKDPVKRAAYEREYVTREHVKERRKLLRQERNKRPDVKAKRVAAKREWEKRTGYQCQKRSAKRRYHRLKAEQPEVLKAIFQQRERNRALASVPKELREMRLVLYEFRSRLIRESRQQRDEPR